MMADEDISLNEDQILDNLDDNGEMLNEVSENIFFFNFSVLFNGFSRLAHILMHVNYLRGR